MATMPEDELQPLITECPNCATRFRLSETHLERARGRVRCGACLTVFDGVAHLVADTRPGDPDEHQAQAALDALLNELAGDPAPGAAPARAAPGAGTRPGAGDSKTPAADATPAPPELILPAAASFEPAPPDKTVDVPFRARSVAPSAAAGAERAVKEDGPKERRGTRSTRTVRAAAAAPTKAPVPAPASEEKQREPITFGEHRPRRPLVYTAIVAGMLLLAAQVLWYQFDDWANDPAWRPLYGALCGVLGCRLPVQRDLTQLETRNLLVRTHESRPGALQVDAVIVNRADFPQPFPVLELQFTTVQGNLVAARRFEPADYLRGDAAGMQLMPRRTPVQIELSMDDPGAQAVNYRLNFR